MTNQQKLIADLIAAKLNYTGPMEQLHAILQLYVDAGVPAAAPPQPEPSAVPAPAAEQKPKPAPAPKPAAKRQLLLSDCKLPVSGFLHLRCPSCGSIHTFCAKQPISAYICRACGATSPLSSDAVPVVRCKDCKHTKTDGIDAIYCEKWDRWEMPEDFFCSYGERKDGEG